MRKIFVLAAIAVAFPLWGFSQDSTSTVTPDSAGNPAQALLEERVGLYEAYAQAKEGFDTTLENMVVLSGKMEQVIKIDDILIDDHLLKTMTLSEELQKKLDEANAKNDQMTKQSIGDKLYFLIAAGAAGLFFLLFLIMMIMLIAKGGKAKKVRKQLAEKDEVMAAEAAKAAESEKALNEQLEKIKKELADAKAAAELEKRTFKSKEAEYLGQVTLIEDKIKKSVQKESDLNYQVFQLELRLKNELEGTIKEKCELENKVVDLERSLSDNKLKLEETKLKLEETKAKLEEERNKPAMNDEEAKTYIEKIAWLEGEVNYFRPLAEGEKLAKETAESALQQKVHETEALYRERDELWGRINQMESRVNDMQNHINHLDGVISGLAHEKGILEEQLRNQQSGDVSGRIAELERQLHEAHEEKSRLYNQIDELLKFVDRFRH